VDCAGPGNAGKGVLARAIAVTYVKGTGPRAADIHLMQIFAADQ
jgi:hypothetical protein